MRTHNCIGAGGIIYNTVTKQILIVKGIKWSLPKGHFNDNIEDPISCAQREIWEETSLIVPINDLNKVIKIKKYMFFVIYMNEQLTQRLYPIDCYEIKDIKWIDPCNTDFNDDFNKQLKYVINNWKNLGIEPKPK